MESTTRGNGSSGGRTEQSKQASNRLSHFAHKIEDLFVQQIDRIAFHHNQEENDYRVQERRLSALMLDKSISDGKHLECAQALIRNSEAYKNGFVNPLRTLNEGIDGALREFQLLLSGLPDQTAAVSKYADSMARWHSLSKELHEARLIATKSIISQVETDSLIPQIVTKNEGRIDVTFDASEQLMAHGAVVALAKDAYENDQRIQKERDPLTRGLFAPEDEVKADPNHASDTPQQTAKFVHPLEGKAWFRLIKMVYVGLWVVGLGISAMLGYGANEILVFIGGVLGLAVVLVILKKAFYYVVLGRTTATEKPGKGFMDLEDLRNDLAAVQANSPDVYQEVVAPFLDSWKAQYGRRVPLHAVGLLQQRVAQEMSTIKEKKEKIINKAARAGATIELSKLRENLEQAKATYQGSDRNQFMRQLDHFIMSLEAKYGMAIPIDEASKLLDTLDEEVRANEKT
jgi:hypothetical protein